MSIRWVVISLVTLLLAVVMGSGYWLSREQIRETVRGVSHKELSLLAESISNNIVNMMNAGADMEALDESYRALQRQHPEILDLRVLHGEAITRQYGFHINEEPRDDIDRRGLLSDMPLVVEKRESGDRDVLRFVYPLKTEAICLKCHQARMEERLGAVSLTLDIGFVYSEINKQQKTQLLIVLGEVLVLLGLLTLVWNTLVFRPLRELSSGAKRLAAGDFSQKVEGVSSNEIGLVIGVFNDMAEQLESLLQNQDGLIREQAIELTELVEQSQLLGSSANEAEVMGRFAKSLTDSAKVTWCCIATLNVAEGYLEIKAAYSVSDMPEMGLHETRLSEQQHPRLWQLMSSMRSAIFQRDDELSADESRLFFSRRESNVLCMPVIHKSLVRGMVMFGEFRSRERDPMDDRKIALCNAMVNLIGSSIEISTLFSRLTEQSEEVVLAMAEAVEKKSLWTAGHSKRVTRYALMIAKEMGWDEQSMEQLRISGLLHDIGKIGMPGLILNKVGKLTAEEYAIVKRHPEDGAQILSKMHLFHELVPAIRHHHEWYNGQGYPEGIRGDEIPLAARILAVADAFDAMTADRPYRSGLTAEEATHRLQQAAGEQFDPEVVAIFTRIYHD
jgi:putative nucleotidyltransferase with HDIG domain